MAALIGSWLINGRFKYNRSHSHSSINLNDLLLRNEDSQISHKFGKERASDHLTREEIT